MNPDTNPNPDESETSADDESGFRNDSCSLVGDAAVAVSGVLAVGSVPVWIIGSLLGHDMTTTLYTGIVAGTLFAILLTLLPSAEADKWEEEYFKAVDSHPYSPVPVVEQEPLLYPEDITNILRGMFILACFTGTAWAMGAMMGFDITVVGTITVVLLAAVGGIAYHRTRNVRNSR